MPGEEGVEGKTLPAVKIIQVGSKMLSSMGSPEESRTREAEGETPGGHLLSIFQIFASLTGVCMDPTDTARSYTGQRRDSENSIIRLFLLRVSSLKYCFNSDQVLIY